MDDIYKAKRFGANRSAAGALLAVMIATPFGLSGADAAGLYVAGGVAATMGGSFDAAQDETRISPATGVTAVGAVGLRLSRLLRLEVEGRYGASGVDDIRTRRLNGLLEPLSATHGHVSESAVTANLLLDAPFHPFGLQPYAGAGAGYARLDFGHAGGLGQTTIDLPDNNRYNGPVNVAFGHGGAFTYQARAGIAVPLLARLALTTEYRFEGMSHAAVPVRRSATNGTLVNGALPTDTRHDAFAPQSNLALVGLRLQFGR